MRRIFLLGLIIFLVAGFIPSTAGMVYAYGDHLEPADFLGNPDYHLTYWYDGENGDSTDFDVKWKLIKKDSYKKTCFYPDGMEDYFYYVNKYEQIYETKTGWTIPESEWTDYEIIEGSNVVCKNVMSGKSWSNEYTTKDGWGSITKEYNAFTFEGEETVEIMGREIPAEKISWEAQSMAQYTDPYAEWLNNSGSSRGEDWYVRGLGLVKRNFLDENGYVASGFYLTGIWDSKKKMNVSIDQWLPMSIVINGTLLDTVGVLSDGDILVPARDILEYLGRPFTWDSGKKVLTLEIPEYGMMSLHLGSSNLETGTAIVGLSDRAVSKLINGKLYVPCSFIISVMGSDEFTAIRDIEGRLYEVFPWGTEPVFY